MIDVQKTEMVSKREKENKKTGCKLGDYIKTEVPERRLKLAAKLAILMVFVKNF